MGNTFRDSESIMIRLICGTFGFLGAVKSQDACKRPIYGHLESRTCTGKGDCNKTPRGLDVCECRLYGRDGYKGYINQGGKRNYGNWCQCNPWNCEPEESPWIDVKTCSGHGYCECAEDDPFGVAKCVCEDNYTGDVCHIRPRPKESACLNPPYAREHAGEECSGRGYCSRDKCNCQKISREGRFGYDGAQTFGKWCHCNQWNCLPKDSAGYSSDQCSGHGVCECDNEDVNSIAKCSCEESYSGDVCQYEDNDGIPVDYDNDGVPDARDDDDDNDGVEDFFEFKYVGSHKGSGEVLNWADLRNKRRASLCPRISSTYHCESIVTTINVGSDKFQKFESIQWLDIENRPKKKILKQFKKQRKFQVHFYEYGITFVTKNGNETMPIRTSPFPILDLY